MFLASQRYVWSMKSSSVSGARSFPLFYWFERFTTRRAMSRLQTAQQRRDWRPLQWENSKILWLLYARLTKRNIAGWNSQQLQHKHGGPDYWLLTTDYSWQLVAAQYGTSLPPAPSGWSRAGAPDCRQHVRLSDCHTDWNWNRSYLPVYISGSDILRVDRNQ